MSEEEELEQPSKEVPKISPPSEQIIERFLKIERTSLTECPVLGIGMTIHCLGSAVKRSEIPSDDIVVISSLQCTSEVAKSVKVDSFHTTQGRSIPFATGMKLANPKLKVVVLGEDHDLLFIGGSHFINAARRNIDITVICINTFDYSLANEQTITDSNEESEEKPPSPGNFNKLFNLPFLAEMAGGVYVARWTGFHFRKVTDSIVDAMNKRGFSFIEVLVPYPEDLEDTDGLENKLDRLKWYYGKSVIQNGANTKEVDIGLGDEIILGRFVDSERPDYLQSMIHHYQERLGDRYKPYEG